MEPTTIALNCSHGVKLQLITPHHRILPNSLMPHSLRFTKKILQLINEIGICLNFLRLDLKLEWNLQLEPSRESQPIILFFLHTT